MSHSRWSGGRALLLLTVVATLFGVAMPFDAPTATAQPDSYRPCADETQTIDLLLMMDRSRSLENATVDPGGTVRREALRQIRDQLAQARQAADIRVALASFDTSARLHAPFAPASTGNREHPSEAAIDDALKTSEGDAAYTDYGAALDEMLRLSAGSEADCRVMLWFTDGLHDLSRGLTDDELRRARDLLDSVCETLRPTFNARDIQTRVVLLGDAFDNPVHPEMANISRGILHAITGHIDSPVVAGLPSTVRCDGVDEQTGEILTVTKVQDLINGLIETIPEPGELDWGDCDALRDGSLVQGAELPGGEYIDHIEVFAYGGEIEEYALAETVAADPGWRSHDERRLRLETDELAGLPAGWTLKMRVSADPPMSSGTGGSPADVVLRCYSKPATSPLQVTGAVVESGQSIGDVDPGETYPLRLDLWPYRCPIDSGDDFVLVPEFPGERLRSSGCEQGSEVTFDYSCGLPPEDTGVERFSGSLAPRFAENLWGRGFAFEVRGTADWTCLAPIQPPPPPPPPRPPRLECDKLDATEMLNGEWSEGVFSGEMVVTKCTISPPDEGETAGTGTAEVSPQSGAFDYHIESPLGAAVDGRLSVGAGDLPREFWIVSEGVQYPGPWDTLGAVEAKLHWQLPHDPVPVITRTVNVPALPSPPPPESASPTFHCGAPRSSQFKGEVPREPLRIETLCSASGPAAGFGELRLGLEWTVPTDGGAAIEALRSLDWRFESGPGLSPDGLSLTLKPGESVEAIAFVTADALPNERHKGSGTLEVTADWHLPRDWDEPPEIDRERLRVDFDLLPRSIWWLALLLTLIAALLTYTLLYAVVARGTKLPRPDRFYARRIEFQATRDPAGGLVAPDLRSISLDVSSLINLTGSPTALRVEDLSIEAEHPRWWPIGAILNGGWGKPSLSAGDYIFGARPSNPRRGSGTTAGQFDELVIVALPARPDTASGIAYLVVPKPAAESDFVRQAPNDVLRDLTVRYDQIATQDLTETAAPHSKPGPVPPSTAPPSQEPPAPSEPPPASEPPALERREPPPRDKPSTPEPPPRGY